MVQRISFLVHGKVQGVSYRYFTQKHATKHSVTGWVRNVAGGRVQGEAQGTGDAIEGFVKDLQKGPSMAVVERVERADLDVVDGEEAFWVRA